MKTPNDIKRKNSNSGSIGQLFRSRGNMVHVSKAFIPNPLKQAMEAAGQPFFGADFVPLTGVTYNVGRNAAKRERRAAAKEIRA